MTGELSVCRQVSLCHIAQLPWIDVLCPGVSLEVGAGEMFSQKWEKCSHKAV